MFGESKFVPYLLVVGLSSDDKTDVYASQNSTLTGSIPITANDATEPSSYLTCLGGAPLDGLRCSIGSYLSVRKELMIQGS